MNIKSIFPVRLYLSSILLFSLFTLLLSSCGNNGESDGKVTARPPKKEIIIDYLDWDAPRSKTLNGISYTLAQEHIDLVEALYKHKAFLQIEERLSPLLTIHDGHSGYDLYTIYNLLGHVTDLKHSPAMTAVLDEWCGLSDSHMPFIVRGIFNISVGWEIRGGGWASTVSNENRKKFHHYLGLAQEDLEKAYFLNPGDPNSSCHLITVAMALGRPQQEIQTLFRSGLAAYPHHYGLHFCRLKSLMPKWGGSRDAMMYFADHCLSLSGEHPYLGLIMVAAMVEFHRNIASEKKKFLKKAPNWQIVYDIYQRFFTRYPDNILRRYYYAYHALTASRNETAIQQFEIIGDQWRVFTPFSSLDRYARSRGRACNNMAAGLFKQQDYTGAVELFHKAILFHPSAQYHYNLALAHWHEAKATGSILSWKNAEKALIKTISIDPDYKSANQDLEKIQAYLKKLGRFG